MQYMIIVLRKGNVKRRSDGSKVLDRWFCLTIPINGISFGEIFHG